MPPPYTRNNQNPDNAMPVWFTAPPGGGTGGFAPIALLRQNIEASQTDVVLGSSGAIGDWVAGFLITPLTTAPGSLQVRDGTAGTYRTIFIGGVGSMLDLSPRPVPYPNSAKATGGWFVTTGANMRVQAFGNWTP